MEYKRKIPTIINSQPAHGWNKKQVSWWFPEYERNMQGSKTDAESWYSRHAVSITMLLREGANRG